MLKEIFINKQLNKDDAHSIRGRSRSSSSPHRLTTSHGPKFDKHLPVSTMHRLAEMRIAAHDEDFPMTDKVFF